MRVHSVVIGSVLGMVGSSALAWAVTPAAAVDATAPSAVEASAAPVGAAAVAATPTSTAPKAQSTFEVPGTITLTGAVGHPTLAAERGGETHVLVSLSGREDPFADPISQASVTIAIDRSGSMRGARMDTALAAARGMISRLRDGDLVSVVAYDNRAQVVANPIPLTPTTRPQLLASLSTLRAGGNTCLSCGVSQALAFAPRGQAINHRVVLLSDGKANRGGRSMADFRGLVDQARRLQTPVTSIGVGFDYDERLLANVSRDTNGGHHFVERLDQLQPIFDQELRNVAQTVAGGTSVEFTLAPGVRLLEVVDRVASVDGNRITVPFGSFEAAQEKTLLLRVRVPGGDKGRQAIGDATLRYRDASTGQRERADGKLELWLGSADAELVPAVEARIAQHETVKAIEEANALVARGLDQQARQQLERTRTRIRTRRKRAAKKSPLQPRTALNFDRQTQALDAASANVNRANKARRKPAAAAARERSAAQKANEVAASPFL